MALSPVLGDREFTKFRSTVNGTAVAVVLENSSGAPTEISALSPTGQEVKLVYNSISSVASGVETLIVSYTVPPATIAILQKVHYAGKNISNYRIEVDAVDIAKFWTWFSGPLDGQKEFSSAVREGIAYQAGSVIKLFCSHERPMVADFTGSIQIVEIDL